MKLLDVLLAALLVVPFINRQLKRAQCVRLYIHREPQGAHAGQRAQAPGPYRAKLAERHAEAVTQHFAVQERIKCIHTRHVKGRCALERRRTVAIARHTRLEVNTAARRLNIAQH